MGKKNKFKEVSIDYTDPETNEIYVDAWLPKSEEGRTVARVTVDGEVLKGTNPDYEDDDLLCPLVIRYIEDAKAAQREEKKKIVDAAIEQIKKDIADEDLTAIDELLHCLPTKILSAYLPE